MHTEPNPYPAHAAAVEELCRAHPGLGAELDQLRAMVRDDPDAALRGLVKIATRYTGGGRAILSMIASGSLVPPPPLVPAGADRHVAAALSCSWVSVGLLGRVLAMDGQVPFAVAPIDQPAPEPAAVPTAALRSLRRGSLVMTIGGLLYAAAMGLLTGFLLWRGGAS
jgi:hypothetical protein